MTAKKFTHRHVSGKRRTGAGRRFTFRRILRIFTYSLVSLVLISAGVVLLFRWVMPPTTPYMLVEGWIRGAEIKYEWQDLSNISPQMRLAVIAAEDPLFNEHFGVHFSDIQQALGEYNRFAHKRANDTLTRQVARNLFLMPGDGPIGEGVEVYFALLIDLLWSKQRILEVHLNTVELGHGVFGVEAASNAYFQHTSTRLSGRQAASLAAIIPSPKLHSVVNPSAYVLERTDWIQRQMQHLDSQAYIQRNQL